MEPTQLTLADLLASEAALIAMIVDKEGEITPELDEAFKTSELCVRKKIDSYAYVIERLEAEALFRSNRAKHEKDIQARLENVAERMREGLKFAMRQHNRTELKGELIRYSLAKSKPSVELRPEISPQEIPDKYKRIKVEVDKTRVLEDWVNGSSVVKEDIAHSFEIKESVSLRKYDNTQAKRKELTVYGNDSIDNHSRR